MTNQNRPFTDDTTITLAMFIGWQVAVLDAVTLNRNPELGLKIVGDAQTNIKTLLLGGSLPLGPTNKISLTDDNGQHMAELLADSLEPLADALDAQEPTNA